MSEETNEKEVNLTYETLFELLRREKNRVEIQQLEKSFFKDFVEYIKTKKQLLEEKQGQLQGSGEDVTKLMIQIDNINKIMKELYDRREKKITSLALMSVKSGSSIPKGSMLEIEEAFYSELLSLFSKYRKGVITNLINQELPSIEESLANGGQEHNNHTNSLSNDSGSVLIPNAGNTEPVLVRFLSYAPKFVDENLETQGPFEAEEITTLPVKIAQILINQGKAEEISGD
jgi:DNA replication initiation complex subunit (GINS family)